MNNPFENPFEFLKKQAEKKNLFGSSRPTAEGFAGDANRLSHKQYEAIRQSVISRVSGNITEERLTGGIYDTHDVRVLHFHLSAKQEEEAKHLFESGMRQLALNTYTGAEIGKLLAQTEVYAHGFYRQSGKELRHVSCGNEQAAKMTHVVNDLAYAVGLLEGNIPPNDLGYFADQAISLVRKDEIALEKLDAAYMFLQDGQGFILPTQYGSLFNAIAQRVEAHRPLFGGSVVRPNAIVHYF